MSETGVTTPRGKVITDEQGKPIRLGAGEGIAQAAGFRPERLARISGEYWTMRTSRSISRKERRSLFPLSPSADSGRNTEDHPGYAEVQYGIEKISGSDPADTRLRQWGRPLNKSRKDVLWD